ncbi:MAG: hypothetical protein RI894_1363 [Bacteroidota bacterium]
MSKNSFSPFIFIGFLCLLFTPLPVNAQGDSTRLTAKFKFKDGFYTTIDQFKHNQPAFALTDFKGSMVPKSSENALELLPNQSTQSLDIQQVWGIVVNGTPYIRYTIDTAKKHSMTYQALQIVGKLCYFSYSIEETTTVPMPVYDPIGGRLLYTGKVKNKAKNTFRKILSLVDGRMTDLNLENLKHYTADDKKLQKSVAELTANDPLQRLLKTLQIYNDRNPIYIH